MRPTRPISGGWLLATSRTRISVIARSRIGYQRFCANTASATISGSARSASSPAPISSGRERAPVGSRRRRRGAAAVVSVWPVRSPSTGSATSRTAVPGLRSGFTRDAVYEGPSSRPRRPGWAPSVRPPCGRSGDRARERRFAGWRRRSRPSRAGRARPRPARGIVSSRTRTRP